MDGLTLPFGQRLTTARPDRISLAVVNSTIFRSTNTTLPHAKSLDPNRIEALCAGQWGWPGAGSNRRPSAFQADARTN